MIRLGWSRHQHSRIKTPRRQIAKIRLIANTSGSQKLKSIILLVSGLVAVPRQYPRLLTLHSEDRPTSSLPLSKASGSIACSRIHTRATSPSLPRSWQNTSLLQQLDRHNGSVYSLHGSDNAFAMSRDDLRGASIHTRTPSPALPRLSMLPRLWGYTT